MKIRDISKVNNKTFKAGNSKYINYLDTGSLRDNNIIELKKLFFDTDIIPSRAKRIVNINNILFSSVRPNQCHYGIYKNQIDNLIVSTGFIVLEIDEAKANPDFVYYCLTSEENILKLQTIAENSTSAYPSIVADDILNLEIKLPSLRVQNSIADLLMKIEKKILLNNKINDNLFKQLNTIYNYWFIQYEFPNENGKPYKSNGGSLKFSNELNTEIPIGFYVQNIINNDISQVIKPGIDVFSNNKIYYATADVDKINIKNGSLITYNNRETRANMQPVVFSVWFAKMKNSIKHLFLNENMIDFINNSILSTGFLGIQCDKISFEYMSSFIEFSSFESKKDMISHGATQQAVNNDDLLNVKLLIPTSDVLNNYHKLAKPLYETISNNICENNRLIKLRNFLLPLLINGQATIS